jgi:phosphate transport system substrate-binding protein
MSSRFITIALLSAIALVGLPSCAPPPSISKPAAAGQEQPKLKLGGSTSSQMLLKLLASSYEAKTQGKATLLEPGQSETVIAGVQQKLADVGAVNKTLKPEDLGDQLTSRVIVKDGLLVATHSTVTGVKNLTTENLKDIYSGTITNWKDLGGPDAKIVLLDRPEDESAKKLLRKHYLGADLKTAPEAVILRKESELTAALQSTPYSIGAFSLATAIANKLPVNALSLNAIEPTADNIKAGKYPMFRQISLLWQKQPTADTQKLIDFAFSSAGAQQLSQAGFVL